MAKKEKVTVEARRPEPRSDENVFSPLTDVYETDDGTAYLTAELPGATLESLEIRVDKGVLTISAGAELPEVGEDYARTYRGFIGGEYFRAFALSDEIDREGIEADLADGVLTLRLPRASAAQTRKIEVKQG